MSRANADDGESSADPMTGDVWSQAHQITIEHDQVPVLMLGQEQEQEQEEDQNRPTRMCAEQLADDSLLRLKRFDATKPDEESKKENTADESLNTETPSPPKKDHQNQRNKNEEENQHTVDELIAQFEKMSGRSGSTMDQEVLMPFVGSQQMMMSEMSPQLDQQNPMLGQQWHHGQHALMQGTPNQFVNYESPLGQAWNVDPNGNTQPMMNMMSPMLGQQNPMLEQQWSHQHQLNHFADPATAQMNDNSESTMLGASPPSALDILSAGAEQMFNPQSLESVSFIFPFIF